MTTRGDWVRAAAHELEAADIPDPHREARHLLRAVLGVPPEHLAAELVETGTATEQEAYESRLRRRVAREPLSHITGERLFWGRSFKVSPAVLDPRPETETLVAEALHHGPCNSVLDLGVGSGCIVLTLLAEWPHAHGTGADISTRALEVASGNAHKLGVSERVDLVQSDWMSSVSGRFDLIVSNPPYISEAERSALAPEVRDHEPDLALFAGDDGLDAYRVLAKDTRNHLNPGGRLLLEVGSGQSEAVCTLLAECGWTVRAVIPDLDHRPRVVVAVI